MLQLQTYETASRADFYAILERETRNGDVVLLDSQLQSHPSSGKSILFAGFDAIFRWKQHSGDMQHTGNARQVGDPQQPGDSQNPRLRNRPQTGISPMIHRTPPVTHGRLWHGFEKSFPATAADIWGTT